MNESLLWVGLSDLDPAIPGRLTAGRWPLAGIPNSQEVAVAQNSPGELLRSLQSSSALFEAAQLPAVPSEPQVWLSYLSESTRVGPALASM